MTGVVTTNGNQFSLDSARYRPIGGNNYGTLYSGGGLTNSQLDAFFAGARRDGMTVIRTWFYNTPNLSKNSTSNYQYVDPTLPGGTREIDLHMPNRSFDGAAGTFAWSMDSDYTLSTDFASDGSKSIKQVSISGSGNFYTYATGLTVVPNKVNTIKFDSKGIASGASPQIQINSGSAFGTPITSAVINPSVNFVTNTITFTPTVSTVWIRIYNGGGNVTYYYDNFTLTYTETTLATMSFSEPRFVYADRVLAAANKYGVKLIMVLENNWETPWIYRPMHDTVYGTHYSQNRDLAVTLSRVGTTVTGTTITPHELYVGCMMWIKGTSDPGFTGGGIKVTSIISPTQFTYNSGTSGTTVATGSPTIGRGLSNSYDVNGPTHQTLFHVPTMKQFTKDTINHLSTRINTVDGIAWKVHPGIFSFELINEGRYDQNNDSFGNGGNSTNGAAVRAFAADQSGFIKYKFPNHMVNFGDSARSLGYIKWPGVGAGQKEDQWQNGSYYGVDDLGIAQIWSIDWSDPHYYLYQWDNQTLRSNPGWFGPSYDFVNGTGYAGFDLAEALRREFKYRIMAAIKTTAGKPWMPTEWGIVKSNNNDGSQISVNGRSDNYPAFPEYAHYQKALYELFSDDADGFIVWHYYGIRGPSGDNGYGIHSTGAYPVKTGLPWSLDPTRSYGTLQTKNSNDDYVMSIFTQWHHRLNGGRPLVGQSLISLRPPSR